MSGEPSSNWRLFPVLETRKAPSGSATRVLLEAFERCETPAVARRRVPAEGPAVVTLEVPAARLLALEDAVRSLRREPLPEASGPADPKALLELLAADLPAAARRDRAPFGIPFCDSRTAYTRTLARCSGVPRQTPSPKATGDILCSVSSCSWATSRGVMRAPRNATVCAACSALPISAARRPCPGGVRWREARLC